MCGKLKAFFEGPYKSEGGFASWLPAVEEKPVAALLRCRGRMLFWVRCSGLCSSGPGVWMALCDKCVSMAEAPGPDPVVLQRALPGGCPLSGRSVVPYHGWQRLQTGADSRLAIAVQHVLSLSWWSRGSRWQSCPWSSRYPRMASARVLVGFVVVWLLTS